MARKKDEDYIARVIGKTTLHFDPEIDIVQGITPRMARYWANIAQRLVVIDEQKKALMKEEKKIKERLRRFAERFPGFRAFAFPDLGSKVLVTAKRKITWLRDKLLSWLGHNTYTATVTEKATIILVVPRTVVTAEELIAAIEKFFTEKGLLPSEIAKIMTITIAAEPNIPTLEEMAAKAGKNLTTLRREEPTTAEVKVIPL